MYIVPEEKGLDVMAWTNTQKAAQRVALRRRGLCTRCTRRRTYHRHALCGRCRKTESVRWFTHYRWQARARQAVSA